MTDALSLIRDYTLQKKEIETKDGLVYLGDFVWDVKVMILPVKLELTTFARQKQTTRFGDRVVMDKQKSTTQSKLSSSSSRTSSLPIRSTSRPLSKSSVVMTRTSLVLTEKTCWRFYRAKRLPACQSTEMPRSSSADRGRGRI